MPKRRHITLPRRLDDYVVTIPIKIIYSKKKDKANTHHTTEKLEQTSGNIDFHGKKFEGNSLLGDQLKVKCNSADVHNMDEATSELSSKEYVDDKDVDCSSNCKDNINDFDNRDPIKEATKHLIGDTASKTENVDIDGLCSELIVDGHLDEDGKDWATTEKRYLNLEKFMSEDLDTRDCKKESNRHVKEDVTVEGGNIDKGGLCPELNDKEDLAKHDKNRITTEEQNKNQINMPDDFGKRFYIKRLSSHVKEDRNEKKEEVDNEMSCSEPSDDQDREKYDIDWTATEEQNSKLEDFLLNNCGRRFHTKGFASDFEEDIAEKEDVDIDSLCYKTSDSEDLDKHDIDWTATKEQNRNYDYIPEISRKNRIKRLTRHVDDGIIDKDKDETINDRQHIDFMEIEDYTNPEFDFTIPYQEWARISFYEATTYKRLSGNWTDIFSKYFNMVQPICVLVFKYNRIARSEKAVNFGHFSAMCKHKNCTAVYKMTIASEPVENEDVIVHVSRTGEISTANEPRSRFAKGIRREKIKEELQNKTPYGYRSELLVDADIEQIGAGNFSLIPTKDVLKQVKAEERQYEKLSDCVIREVYAVKRTFDILDVSSRNLKGYIQYVGFEPFFIINYCGEQIDLLAEACRKEDAFLYFDATGLSMKRPLDQPKRLYLYCLVLRTSRHSEGIRISEMITNDHTTPSISNFLMRVRHALTSGRQFKAPRKIETDFSFAMIHAACRAFNSSDLSSYLRLCWKSLSNNKDIDNRMSILHICAAHMLKIFQKMLACCTEDKQQRKFWLYVFARLQTSESLEMAKRLVQDITSVCKSKALDKKALRSLDRLKTTVQLEEGEGEVDVCYNEGSETSNDTADGTLRTQSPFYGYFTTIISEAYISDSGESNAFYCSSIIDKLLKDYLPFFPLWSGVLLSQNKRNINENSNRDSNAVVERQFATIKNDILLKERNINPGKACRLLYIAAKGIAKSAIASSKSIKDIDDTQEKEKWQKRGKKDNVKKRKKSKYFSTPSKKDLKQMQFVKDEPCTIPSLEDQERNVNKPERKTPSKNNKLKLHKAKKRNHEMIDQGKQKQERKHKKQIDKENTSITSRNELETKSCLEAEQHDIFQFTDNNAMPWGGFDKKYTGISLSNTCPIDNILTALYVIFSVRSDIVQKLKDCNDTAIQLILELCLNEMTQRKWIQAKIKFVRDLLRIQGSRVDLFGSEFEMAVRYLVTLQRYTTTTVCKICNAQKSTLQNIIELDDGPSKNITIQELLLRWERGHVTGSRCPARCDGDTLTFRNFEDLPVLLIITVDMPSASGNLKTDSLVEPIFIDNTRYDLYAATTNEQGHHFRLIVRSHLKGPWYSYDGLRTSNKYRKLSHFHCQEREIFVNLIFVRSAT